MLNKQIESIWEKFDNSYIPVHSFLAEQGGVILQENYKAPYDSHSLHRMFSITKSFTALAVGFLTEDGLISLDDSITKYFPEYRPDGGFHPWLEAMTIRHMLTMKTCHTSTTYKINSDKNWVESFFITPPTHRSGQIFVYDTSSSHTLAALVKKVSGKGVLDYLREKCLGSMGGSEDAYIVTDPFGAEMGGSGLLARPMDLLKLGRYLLDTLKTGNSVFAGFLKEAVDFQTATIYSGQTLEEQQGYGYQFWRIRNGFAMFGMGGQYLICYPDIDFVCVITADTQNIKGGTEILLDTVNDALREILPPYKLKTPEAVPLTWNANYRFFDNVQGFIKMELSFEPSEGKLTLYHQKQVFTIPICFDKLSFGTMEKYNQKIAVKAMWADSNVLYLPIQITDECVGSIHMALTFDEKNVTLFMRKIEETYFNEFQGFLEGERCI